MPPKMPSAAQMSNLAGLGSAQAGTITMATSYPGMANIYVPPPPYPANYPSTPGFVGRYKVRKVDNGYIIEYALHENGATSEYFAADLKEVGEKVTALCVQKVMEGNKP